MRDALQRQIGNQALACIGLLLKWSKLCAKSLTKPRHRMAWSKEGLTQSLQIDILLSRAVQTFEHHSRELFLHTIHSVSVYGRQAAQRRAQPLDSRR